MFNFSNYSSKSKHYDGSKKLAIGKMKDEIGVLAKNRSVGLKPKIYSFLKGNSEHIKAIGVNKNK